MCEGSLLGLCSIHDRPSKDSHKFLPVDNRPFLDIPAVPGHILMPEINVGPIRSKRHFCARPNRVGLPRSTIGNK